MALSRILSFELAVHDLGVKNGNHYFCLALGNCSECSILE